MSTQDTKQPPSSLSDAINMLMENPSIISSVASALGNLSVSGDSQATNTVAEAQNEPDAGKEARAFPPPDLSALAATLTPLMSGRRNSERRQGETDADRREALLCALKPYVSEGRREAIDYIIRISRMSEALKTIQS